MVTLSRFTAAKGSVTCLSTLTHAHRLRREFISVEVTFADGISQPRYFEEHLGCVRECKTTCIYEHHLPDEQTCRCNCMKRCKEDDGWRVKGY